MTEIEALKKELSLQKKIAYTAGMLHSDVTTRTIIESLSEGIVIINQDCRIVLINKSMEKLFGYSQEEVIGETLDIYLPSNIHHKHNDYIKTFFSNPSIRPMGIGVELFGVTKEKVHIPVEIGISFLKTEFGTLGLASITDISIRKKIEQELLERNRELDEFSHIVAHDLNSNVYGIVGSAEELLNHSSSYSEEQRKEFLEYILKGGYKMSHIIRELLLFATMKKGDVNCITLDMVPIIHEAISRLKLNIEECDGTISIQEPLDLAKGYAPWVEEIWLNLISNGLKYGGKPPIIEISSKKFEKHIEYFISDNGQGLSQQDFKKIISNKQSDSKRIAKGHGLGLEIVSRILSKLEGELKLSTSASGGSTFSFTLPSTDDD
jgi:PAS domain S-box-containing protein